MVQSNFDFLRPEFPAFFREAFDAEEYTFKEPRDSASLCRSAMEKAVLWLYENDLELDLPFGTKLDILVAGRAKDIYIRDGARLKLNKI